MVYEYSIFWVIAFIIQIQILSYSAKNIFNNLYLLFYKFFKNEKTVVYIVSFILLPGTFIHELSHAITCVLMGGRVSKFSVWPKVEGGHIKMGYAEVEVLDIFRNTLIGISPLIFGVSILFYVSTIFSQVDLIMQIFLSYIVFQVANSMFLSDSDVKEFYALIFILTVFIVFLYFVNFNYLKIDFLPQDINIFLTNTYLTELRSLNNFFLIPLLINFIFLIISKLILRHR